MPEFNRGRPGAATTTRTPSPAVPNNPPAPPAPVEPEERKPLSLPQRSKSA